MAYTSRMDKSVLQSERDEAQSYLSISNVCNKHKTITTNHNNIENIRTEDYEIPGINVDTNSGSGGTVSNKRCQN